MAASGYKPTRRLTKTAVGFPFLPKSAAWQIGHDNRHVYKQVQRHAGHGDAVKTRGPRHRPEVSASHSEVLAIPWRSLGHPTAGSITEATIGNVFLPMHMTVPSAIGRARARGTTTFSTSSARVARCLNLKGVHACAHVRFCVGAWLPAHTWVPCTTLVAHK